MARRRRRSRARVRRRRSAPAGGTRTRRRRRRGGFSFGRGKFGVAMPTMEAATIGIAAAAGEVLMLLLTKFGVPVPDWIPEKALGIWAWGWWKRNTFLQQVGYGLVVVEMLENSGAVEKVKEIAGVATAPSSSPDQGALTGAEEAQAMADMAANLP